MNICTQAVKRAGAVGHEVASKTREIGILGVLRLVVSKLIQRWRRRSATADAFDAKYGTDTAKIVGVWALDIPWGKLEHANRYETVDHEQMAANFASIKIPHRDFVFLDFGSGKGRALLLASRFPFKAIIGIELSAGLVEIANRNLARFHDDSQQCRNIRCICMDATDYQLPEENILLYLYNPFDERVMNAVVSKMETFLRHSAKQVYVLYHYPIHKSLWEKSDFFEPVNVQTQFAVFRNKKCPTAQRSPQT